MRPSRTLYAPIIATVAAVGAPLVCGACATSPLDRSQLSLVSDEEMAQGGSQAFQQIGQKTPVSADGTQTRSVSCVAAAVTHELPSNAAWEVKVFDSNNVNAFALPGGHIGVYTSLLKAAWEVKVFDSNNVNAFALPGGHIGVYTSLLKVATSQDHLAIVIGHEVSYVLARHSAERYSQQAATGAGRI